MMMTYRTIGTRWEQANNELHPSVVESKSSERRESNLPFASASRDLESRPLRPSLVDWFLELGWMRKPALCAACTAPGRLPGRRTSSPPLFRRSCPTSTRRSVSLFNPTDCKLFAQKVSE
jgi:hypothetical protein